MRTQETNQRISTAIALALGMLMTMSAAPAQAACPSVVVLGTSVSNGGVNVTVKNYSILPQIKTVAVQAVVGDTALWSLVPVSLLPGQTATVRAGFVGVVSTVITVGMTDDGSPL